MQVRDNLVDKSILLDHFKKTFPLTLLEHSFQKDLTDYYFVSKVTRVFPIPTQAEYTEDGEHFANY